MARADKFTLTQKKVEIYSDFLTNFTQNPHTGFLGKVSNENAVAQSMRNLMLTDKGERFYNANLGGDIRSQLFELADPISHEPMIIAIKSFLATYEPRAVIQDVVIQTDDNDHNTLNIKIVYTTKNIQDQARTLDIHLERVR